jgi:hypothetical protein
MLEGATSGGSIVLGSMALGVAAQSLLLPVSVEAAGLEINVRDSFTQLNTLTINDLNIRVFGNDEGITLSAPVVAAESVQLIAPDGEVVLPGEDSSLRQSW